MKNEREPRENGSLEGIEYCYLLGHCTLCPHSSNHTLIVPHQSHKYSLIYTYGNTEASSGVAQ
jgi:hypothetical protein